MKSLQQQIHFIVENEMDRKIKGKPSSITV